MLKSGSYRLRRFFRKLLGPSEKQILFFLRCNNERLNCLPNLILSTSEVGWLF